MPATSAATAAAAPRASYWRGIAHQLDYHRLVYLRTWRSSVVSSFLSPLLYVVAMGVLLGGFIPGDPAKLEGATSYLAFLVPGLVASQAMQTAVGETTYPVMGSIKWHRAFHAQLATPLTVAEIVGAYLLFVLFRVGTTCTVFMLVLAPFGLFATWWGWLLALGSQILVGMAFAALTFAWSAQLTSESGFGVYFRLVVFPMALFSGAFFPIANLGPVLAGVARCTPLWHGVNLSRMFSLDNVDWGLAAVNVTVLATLLVVGYLLAVRNLTRRLVT